MQVHNGSMRFAAWLLIAATLAITDSARGGVHHPIQVSIRPLDSLQRGRVVRLEVRATSATPITRGEIRMASAGGAAVHGPQRVTLGRLTPGRERRAEFRIAIPAQGHRFLVQFEVTGEGPTGRLSRGATYNLLPDGPAQTRRVVSGPNGESIAEVRARRIGR